MQSCPHMGKTQVFDRTTVIGPSGFREKERKKKTDQEKKKSNKNGRLGTREASLIGLHVLRTLVLLSGTLQSLPLHKCQIFIPPYVYHFLPRTSQLCDAAAG